jgi:hypothetical protein
MSLLLRVLVAAGWLYALLPVGFEEGAPLSPGALGAVGSLSCDAARPVSADFDNNGIEDWVALSNRSGRDTLHLVLNGSHQVVLEAASPCRLRVLDFDHDSDADLIALTRQGELQIWGNEDGAFRLLQPKGPSSRPALSSALHPWATALDGNFVTSRGVVLVEPPDPKYFHSTGRRYRTRDRGSFQTVWRDQSLARPPPAS